MAIAFTSKPQTQKATPVKRGAKPTPVSKYPIFERTPGFGFHFPQGAIAPTIQPKLTIGEPNDKYEQEADRVADQVMQMPDSQVTGATALSEAGQSSPQSTETTSLSLQRKCSECTAESETSLQRSSLPFSVKHPKISALNGSLTARFKRPSLVDSVQKVDFPRIQQLCTECEDQLQRQPMPEEEEEEETLQTKLLAMPITPLVQRQAEPIEEEEAETLQTKTVSGELSTVSTNLQNQIAALQEGGQPLPQSERAFFEPRFGADFSQVRIHADSRAAKAAHKVNAKAFTLEHNIVFGAGQYQPSASEGRRLLAHELTHVLQQGQGLPSTIQTFRITHAANVPSLAMRNFSTVVLPGKWNQLRRKLNQRDSLIAGRLRLVSTTSSDHGILTRLQSRWPSLRTLLSSTSFDPATGTLPSRRTITRVRSDELADKAALTGRANRFVRGAIQEFVNALDAYLDHRDMLAGERTEYHRFDRLFVARDVSTLLAAIPNASFTTADVKALVDQETGDLLNFAIHGISRTTTGIQRFRRLNRRGHLGLGQHSATARNEAISWASTHGVTIPSTPNPRTIPAESIKLTAAFIGRMMDILWSRLPAPKPTGDELKKMIFAAYNAGQVDVIRAATSFLGGRSRSYSWNDIKNQPSIPGETRNYVSGILTRLS